MAFSLYMIILFPAIGLIGDAFSLETAFILIAGLGTLLYGFYLFTLRQARIRRAGLG